MQKQNGFYPKVSLIFSKLRDAQLVLFTRNLVSQMTGNTNYPTPSPTLQAISDSVDQFAFAVQEGLNGGKVVVATRNANRQSLLILLRALAAYVTGNCHEDVLTLITSGFEAVKVAGPVGPLSAPLNPRLSYTGLSGELLFRFKGDKNVRNFTIESAVEPDGLWENRGLSTSSRVVLPNLIPGKIYRARSKANGAAGSSDWSVPTSVMAV